MELRDKVTVFLITVGASSYDRAKKALQNQDSFFTLKEIAWVAPMSAAFQQMIERCKTPYFIQCDEDMICRPHAVRTLYESIATPDMSHAYYSDFKWPPDKCAMVCYPLWDTHLQRSRLGIKIYRHEAMVKAPYSDIQSCEMDQIAKLKALHYHFRTEWGSEWSTHKGCLKHTDRTILALHGTSYTPRESFETYVDMAQKCRDVGGNDWFRDHPAQFLERVSKGKPHTHMYNDSDLWALLGSVVGFTSPKETREERGEKHFKKYYKNQKFGELRSMLIPPPQRLDVYTTSKCNLKCDFCGRQQGGVDMNILKMARDEDLPGIIARVLGYYPSITSACLAGFGDPLLCDSLNETMTVLNDQYIGLITNGVALIEKRVDWASVNHLTVSLNAADAAEHAQRTGVTNGWERVTSGLAMLNHIKVPFTLSFVVGQKEWANVPRYLQAAKDLKAKSVYFVNLLPHHNDQAGADWFRANAIHYGFDAFFQQRKRFEQKANELGVQVEVWPQPVSWSIRPRNCTGPWTALGIDSRGYYGACPRVTGPGPHWGHIDEGKHFWEKSATITKLRRELSGADRELRSTCQNCFGCWQHR
jgi:MoaA/NifB/PqqE/SkfB family radical SAM enzyme